MTQENGIVWEEPYGRAGRTEWQPIAEALRARPREWARVKTGAKKSTGATLAARIKTGAIAPFRPAGAFEAKSRTIEDGTAVYARYVGEATR